MAFSEKQLEVLRFPYTGYDALICDGAVRSGKTSVMSLSFIPSGGGKKIITFMFSAERTNPATP